VKGFHWHGAERPSYFSDPFILCDLETFHQPFLADPSVPNWHPVSQDRDDQCVVDPSPVMEVEPAYGVA